MISTTIEKTILDFDHCRYDVHSLHDLEDEPYLQQWRADLARAISNAIRADISRVHRNMLSVVFNGIPG